MNNCLKNIERLKGKKNIENIFINGKKNYQYFINFIYITNKNITITKIGVFVPKQFLKKAVERNMIKRFIKTAYRLNKNILHRKYYHIIFLYKNKKLMDYHHIDLIIKKILQYLANIDEVI